ncbi:hypothetical protein [Solibacillus daqui]|nr:hypothetical protein [Solibacillus daqui]
MMKHIVHHSKKTEEEALATLSVFLYLDAGYHCDNNNTPTPIIY